MRVKDVSAFRNLNGLFILRIMTFGLPDSTMNCSAGKE